mgnify:CR=1 FL=1
MAGRPPPSAPPQMEFDPNDHVLAVWHEDPAQRIEQMPGVLVLGTAVGLEEDLIFWKLEALAAQGFLAFGADLFGSGHALWDRSENVPTLSAAVNILDRTTQRTTASWRELRRWRMVRRWNG